MSLAPITDGELAAVVTYLEMRDRPAPVAIDTPLRLEPLRNPAIETYRALFRLVGSRWLWFSRLILADAALGDILGHPEISLFVVRDEGNSPAGLLDLDFRTKGECELAFVGLVPELSGKGHGRWLLAEALRLAWRGDVHRVHVHTCTLDHPAALAVYRRAGFIPYRRAVETFADPRLLGILPRDCAPQVPLVSPASNCTVTRPSIAE